MAVKQEDQSNPQSLLKRAVNATGVLLTAGLAVSAIVVGVTALHSIAADQAAPKANPLITVATQPVIWSDHYEVDRGYVGRIEPTRETAVAFERGGLVVEIRFDEGDKVKAGAVIARLDSSKLMANRRELQARRQELVARRELAKLTMSRQSKLKTRGWSPEQRFDEARFNVAELDASIARVEASIAALDIDIAKSDVKAPFDGTVASRNLDEGTVVAAGTRLLTVLEAAKQQAHIGVSPEAAKALAIGQTYSLSANQHDLTGRLTALRRDLEAGSRTLTALFSVDAGGNVPLREVAVLNLPRKVKTRGMWLPITALVEGRKGLWTVMLAKESGEARTIVRETVEVLHVAGNQAYVRGALKKGDHVVTTGTNRVTPGQQVAAALVN